MHESAEKGGVFNLPLAHQLHSKTINYLNVINSEFMAK